MTLLFCVASPAFASKACYSPEQLQAEQLLRLHSELMVISYSCKYSTQNYNLITVYTAFTQNNLALLQQADQTMLRYFKSLHGGDGTARLDDLHTKLGNEMGQAIADESLESFCDKNRDRPLNMYFAGNVGLDAELNRMMGSAKSIGTPCQKVAANTKK